MTSAVFFLFNFNDGIVGDDESHCGSVTARL